jgi:hypothetical protein
LTDWTRNAQAVFNIINQALARRKASLIESGQICCSKEANAQKKASRESQRAIRRPPDLPIDENGLELMN